MRLAVKLPVSISKEGKLFVAYTPALDLSTSAKSYEKAKKRFDEAVSIFFEYTTKNGTLGDVLSDLGWSKIKNQWAPPTIVSQGIEEVRIPANV